MTTLDFISSSINNAKIKTDPFSYLYINKFFDPNFYQKLLKSIPDKNEYQNLSESNYVTGDYPKERYIYDISPESFKNFNEMQKNIFKDIVDSLLSPDFFNLVVSKFKSTIDNRIKNFSPEEIKLFGTSDFKFDARIQLVKDYTKYQLGAHTDSPHKFLTFLFYLPEDNSLSNLGTSLYKPITSEFNGNYNRHESIEDTKQKYTEISRANFLPNSVLIFPRTDDSFHGVSSINTGNKERNLLLLNYYFKEKIS